MRRGGRAPARGRATKAPAPPVGAPRVRRARARPLHALGRYNGRRCCHQRATLLGMARALVISMSPRAGAGTFAACAALAFHRCLLYTSDAADERSSVD